MSEDLFSPLYNIKRKPTKPVGRRNNQEEIIRASEVGVEPRGSVAGQGRKPSDGGQIRRQSMAPAEDTKPGANQQGQVKKNEPAEVPTNEVNLKFNLNIKAYEDEKVEDVFPQVLLRLVPPGKKDGKKDKDSKKGSKKSSKKSKSKKSKKCCGKNKKKKKKKKKHADDEEEDDEADSPQASAALVPDQWVYAAAVGDNGRSKSKKDKSNKDKKKKKKHKGKGSKRREGKNAEDKDKRSPPDETVTPDSESSSPDGSPGINENKKNGMMTLGFNFSIENNSKDGADPSKIPEAKLKFQLQPEKSKRHKSHKKHHKHRGSKKKKKSKSGCI